MLHIYSGFPLPESLLCHVTEISIVFIVHGHDEWLQRRPSAACGYHWQLYVTCSSISSAGLGETSLCHFRVEIQPTSIHLWHHKAASKHNFSFPSVFQISLIRMTLLIFCGLINPCRILLWHVACGHWMLWSSPSPQNPDPPKKKKKCTTWLICK